MGWRKYVASDKSRIQMPMKRQKKTKTMSVTSQREIEMGKAMVFFTPGLAVLRLGNPCSQWWFV